MQLVEFNVNNYVWVKLNERGQERFRDYHEGILRPYYSQERIRDMAIQLPEPDEDGFYQLQLHHFMQVFGPVIFVGCQDYFDATIKFEL